MLHSWNNLAIVRRVADVPIGIFGGADCRTSCELFHGNRALQMSNALNIYDRGENLVHPVDVRDICESYP